VGYDVGPDDVREDVARGLREQHQKTQKYDAELAAGPTLEKF
jgi:hypothetical protein